MNAPTIKGFKHLRPGAEAAIRRSEKFGRDVSYIIRTIQDVDYIAGVITVCGSAREFGFDGYELGEMRGEPRQRLLAPVPDYVRREIWRDDAHDRLQILLHNWNKVDDATIERVLAALDGGDVKDNAKNDTITPLSDAPTSP